MKILTTALISLFLLESSVAFADPNHYDVEQDEFWHGAETTAIHHTTSPSNKVSVKPYDVEQDEFGDSAGQFLRRFQAVDHYPW